MGNSSGKRSTSSASRDRPKKNVHWKSAGKSDEQIPINRDWEKREKKNIHKWVTSASECVGAANEKLSSLCSSSIVLIHHHRRCQLKFDGSDVHSTSRIYSGSRHRCSALYACTLYPHASCIRQNLDERANTNRIWFVQRIFSLHLFSLPFAVWRCLFNDFLFGRCVIY